MRSPWGSHECQWVQARLAWWQLSSFPSMSERCASGSESTLWRVGKDKAHTGTSGGSTRVWLPVLGGGVTGASRPALLGWWDAAWGVLQPIETSSPASWQQAAAPVSHREALCQTNGSSPSLPKNEASACAPCEKLDGERFGCDLVTDQLRQRGGAFTPGRTSPTCALCFVLSRAWVAVMWSGDQTGTDYEPRPQASTCQLGSCSTQG